MESGLRGSNKGVQNRCQMQKAMGPCASLIHGENVASNLKEAQRGSIEQLKSCRTNQGTNPPSTQTHFRDSHAAKVCVCVRVCVCACVRALGLGNIEKCITTIVMGQYTSLNGLTEGHYIKVYGNVKYGIRLKLSDIS